MLAIVAVPAKLKLVPFALVPRHGRGLSGYSASYYTLYRNAESEITMTGCLRSLTAILALRILLLPTSLLATAPGDAPSCNAVFVAMSVPEKVAACEVFPVTVTMRNTGTATWQGWPICLRSVNPRGNVTWGTDYILIAQGTAVKPGEEYTFRSNLRAPAERYTTAVRRYR